MWHSTSAALSIHVLWIRKLCWCSNTSIVQPHQENGKEGSRQQLHNPLLTVMMHPRRFPTKCWGAGHQAAKLKWITMAPATKEDFPGIYTALVEDRTFLQSAYIANYLEVWGMTTRTSSSSGSWLRMSGSLLCAAQQTTARHSPCLGPTRSQECYR
jgi:hypothetical protein